MKKFLTILSFQILVLPFLFVPDLSSQTITDLIQPVHLTAGVPDSIHVSDLFYANNYKVKFYPDKNINAEYNQSTGMVAITSSKYYEGIDLLGFSFYGKRFFIPVISEVPQRIEFTYNPAGQPKSVYLFGSFNGWNRSELKMKDENGVYKISIPVEPGRYEYKFYVDGNEILDPANPVKTPNGMGGFNSVISVNPRHTDKCYLHLLGKNISKDGMNISFFYEKENQSSPITYSNLIPLINNNRIPEDKIKIHGDSVDVLVSGRSLKKDVVIRLAVTQDGQSTNFQTIDLNKGIPAGNDKNISFQDQIIYSIMIDRFFDGDKSNDKPVVQKDLSFKANYQGGDFQGIIDKINSGYFNSLGVNTLWISPVVDNPDSAYKDVVPPYRYFTGYHGYWPLHSTKVEEHFGTMSLLKKLVSDAHKHGLKILLDYVAHHVFIQNPLYKKHRDWFGVLDLPDGRKNLQLWDEYRLTTWFEPYLPTFNYVGSKAAREAMTDNAVWWLKQTDADGFRHDAVKHIPNVFWRLLTKKMEKEIEIPDKKKLYQIGETFGSYQLVSSYVNNGQLNAQFNFNLYDVAIPTFIRPGAPFTNLDNELHKSFSIFGVNNLMGNIMDSHDKVRFMAYADGDISLDASDAAEIGWKNPPEVHHKSSYKKLRLYLSYLLTIPGVPVIDYGDEIGMTGAADPDNRRMMRFGNQLTEQEKENLSDVIKLIKIRDDNPALRYGDFETLLADTNSYVFLRSDLNERILVALNKGSESETLKIILPAVYRLSSAEDLLSEGKESFRDDEITITLPAVGYKIFKLK